MNAPKLFAGRIMFAKYFKQSEFYCPCCRMQQMDFSFIAKIDKARKYAGVPFIITSGWRCARKNASLPGASPTSKHMYGKACDILVKDNYHRRKILKALLDVPQLTVGVYANKPHMHVQLMSESNSVCYVE